MTEDDEYQPCPSCQCNQYHCLCDVIGRPLTKQETAKLYWLAATNIDKFDEICRQKED